jgi:hypothetical protein
MRVIGSDCVMIGSLKEGSCIFIATPPQKTFYDYDKVKA